VIEVHRASEEKAKADVIAEFDPTGFSVSWSFQVHGVEPPKPADTPSAWTAGSWQTTPGDQLATYKWLAVALSPIVGAGGLDLAVGVYDMYVTVPAGSAGNPVKPAGMLRVR